MTNQEFLMSFHAHRPPETSVVIHFHDEPRNLLCVLAGFGTTATGGKVKTVEGWLYPLHGEIRDYAIDRMARELRRMGAI